MYSRRLTLPSNNFSHVTFRCHNKSHLFENDEIKKAIMGLWATYKKRYEVKIYDFIIMDNHAHMLVKGKTTEGLGNFMRVVNSLTARMVNKMSGGDSQVIKERYKSPMITNDHYLINTMQYIWLNRFKVNRSRPEKDPYCSLSWRLNPACAQSICHDKEQREQLTSLLDPLDEVPALKAHTKKIKDFLRSLLAKALEKISELCPGIYQNSHTIGDEDYVSLRGTMLSAFKRDLCTWTPPPDPEPPPDSGASRSKET